MDTVTYTDGKGHFWVLPARVKQPIGLVPVDDAKKDVADGKNTKKKSRKTKSKTEKVESTNE